MNIHATSVASHHVRAAELPNALRMSDRPDKPATHSRDTPKVDRSTVDAREEGDDASTELRADGDGRDVLRLLEAGHFKGVADVRLRINFFDELSSRARVAALPAIEEQAGEVVSAVQARVDELMDTLELGDETLGLVSDAVAAFDQAVQTLADQAISAGRVDPDALASEIQLAFDGLVEQLEALLVNPTPEAEPPEPSVPAPDGDAIAGDQPENGAATPLAITVGTVNHEKREPETEPPGDPNDQGDAPAVSYDEAFASIREAFEDALATLISSLNQAVQLPDPTSPPGQGQAFAKFLAMYDELRGTPQTIDATV